MTKIFEYINEHSPSRRFWFVREMLKLFRLIHVSVKYISSWCHHWERVVLSGIFQNMYFWTLWDFRTSIKNFLNRLKSIYTNWLASGSDVTSSRYPRRKSSVQTRRALSDILIVVMTNVAFCILYWAPGTNSTLRLHSLQIHSLSKYSFDCKLAMVRMWLPDQNMIIVSLGKIQQ